MMKKKPIAKKVPYHKPLSKFKPLARPMVPKKKPWKPMGTPSTGLGVGY